MRRRSTRVSAAAARLASSSSSFVRAARAKSPCGEEGARGAGRGVGLGEEDGKDGREVRGAAGEVRGARAARGKARGGARALTLRYLRTNRIAHSSTVGSLAAIWSRARRGLRRVRLVPTNQRPRGGTAGCA